MDLGHAAQPASPSDDATDHDYDACQDETYEGEHQDSDLKRNDNGHFTQTGYLIAPGERDLGFYSHLSGARKDEPQCFQTRRKALAEGRSLEIEPACFTFRYGGLFLFVQQGMTLVVLEPGLYAEVQRESAFVQSM